MEATAMRHDLSQSTTGGPCTDRTTTIVRQARRDDAAAIAAIYNQAILARTSTFETTPHTARQIEAVLAERGDRYPTMVVERGQRIVGWAASNPHSTRPSFASIVEYSVYVERMARGTGVGRAALEALIQECERRGFRKALGRIFPENTASRALARSLGFREVGVLMRHGPVDGRWRDAVLVEKLLGSDSGRAAPGQEQTEITALRKRMRPPWLLAQATVALLALALASPAFAAGPAATRAAATLQATGMAGPGVHAPGPVPDEGDTPIIRGSGR